MRQLEMEYVLPGSENHFLTWYDGPVEASAGSKIL